MPYSNRTRLITFGLTSLTLIGCASGTPALEAHSESFGLATAQNIAAQRVAPSAEDKANTFIPPNRARQKAAREAYESGTTPKPTSVVTSDLK